MVPATATSELSEHSGPHVTSRWSYPGEQRCRLCGAGPFRSARTRRAHERRAHERRVSVSLDLSAGSLPGDAGEEMNDAKA